MTTSSIGATSRARGQPIWHLDWVAEHSSQMADPSDTAALCNDARGTAFDQGQPTDLDIEAGAVIGEEPTSLGDDPNTEKTVDGEPKEEEEDGETANAEATQNKTEFKVPFVYLIVEPGCTPLSCYSAILTFIVMSCGVFWLLLISPPLNAKPYETRTPWLNGLQANVSESPDPTLEDSLASGSEPSKLEVASLLDAEPDAALLNAEDTLDADSSLSGDGGVGSDIVSAFMTRAVAEEINQT
ncbi:hypothetical protein FHG87_009199 [Trinorchestia longiramus]|nr:hypothetical protein FHG87_009199 [Trinorchestia longiramus]